MALMKSRVLGLVLLATLPAFPLTAIEPKLDVTSQMETVERIRQMEFLRPVDGFEIDSNELEAKLRSMFDSDLPVSAEDYGRILIALHLIEPSEADPVETLLALYQSQVLAFYDPETHIFYSVEGAGGPGMNLPGMRDVVLVHELVHALQDQRYSAGATLESRRHDWDSSLVYQTLLEGEAMLVMLGTIGDLEEIAANDELLDMMAVLGPGAASMGLDVVPEYFVDSMIFPYTKGLDLMARSFREGGWQAVGKLFDNPPTSTAQLLHRGDPPPIEVTLPRVSHSMIETTFGEFHWSMLVGPASAAGWRGDRLAVFGHGESLTVITDTRWTNATEAEEFENGLISRLENDETNLEVRRDGASVRAGWGGDRAAIEQFVVRGLNRERIGE